MKKLKDYLIELTIITLGLLIAFWIENYRESKNQAEETKQILINIEQDIVSVSNRKLEYSILLDTVLIPKVKKIITDLDDCKTDDIESLYLATGSGVYLPYAKNSSFEALKSSGLISNIEDDTLIAAFNDIFDFSYDEAVNESWVKIGDKIANVLYELEGLSIRTNEDGEYKFSGHFVISRAKCNRLKIHFVELHDLIQGEIGRLKHNSNSHKSWLDRLEREIKRK